MELQDAIAVMVGVRKCRFEHVTVRCTALDGQVKLHIHVGAQPLLGQGTARATRRLLAH